MTEISELFHYAFFQRALIASFLLACMTGIIGVFMILRHASFFGDTISHSSLAGVAIGLFFHQNPLLIALLYAITISAFLPWIKSKINFSFDNILGIILPLSMGIGVMIFSLIPGYQPELLSYLFGSIVSVTSSDIIALLILLASITLFLSIVIKQLVFVSVDEEYARLVGINTRMYDMIFHIFLACVIIAGIQIVGVILINALLIIPASIAKLFARSLKQLFVFSLVISFICVLGGMMLSLLLNTPTGASIAAFSGALFLIVFISTLRK